MDPGGGGGPWVVAEPLSLLCDHKGVREVTRG